MLDEKALLAILSICVCLASCNRGNFGGRGDTISPDAQVDIDINMASPSLPNTLGKGQVRVYASYPLALSCDNCSLLGITLSFSEGIMEGKRYTHTADFDYSLVTKTEVCALQLRAVSKGSKKINSIKNYNVYVCPQGGTTGECDTANAVPSCAHIGR